MARLWVALPGADDEATRRGMTEEAFLRYRMAVVERMPDSPSKRALLIAIESRMAALKLRDSRRLRS